MDKKLRAYFQKIGRKGGLKKKLTSEQAKAMVAARERKKRLTPRGKTVILTMLLLHGATTYAGQGWYFLLPPMGGPVAGFPNTDAPLRWWIQLGAFDTANACEDWRVQYANYTEKKDGKNSMNYKQALSSVCIASDDPRLTK